MPANLPPASGGLPATQRCACPRSAPRQPRSPGGCHHRSRAPLTPREEQRVGRDSPLVRRGFEPAPGVTPAGIHSICKQRFFKKNFLPAQRRWAQRGNDHMMAELFMSWSAQLCLQTLPRCHAQGTCNLQLIPECLDLGRSRSVQCLLVGDHVFSPPWEITQPEAFPDLTCRPGTSQGSGRSSRWRRGCRFPRAGRAWTRRDCPPAHSAHQKTAQGRCRCNLERMRVLYRDCIHTEELARTGRSRAWC